jgi:hypothetical protein
MGMFDEYQPEPSLSCPNCGHVLRGWQGKDGPCALLQWKQGEPSPIGQNVDEGVRLPVNRLAQFGLPERFELYTACSKCQRSFDATGICEGNVWKHCTFGRHAADSPVPARSIADSWRQCSACADAWEDDPLRVMSECPSCKTLTRLVSDASA